MSEFSEFRDYVLNDVKAKGHIIGPLYWAPYRWTPCHETRCKICDGKIQIYWDIEELMWLADGDLLQGCADVIACDWEATR
jgi:hypothetical protein